MNIICSANQTVQERWRQSLSDAGAWDVASDLDVLKGLLAAAEPEVLLLHLSLPGLGGGEGVMVLRRAYPNVRLLVFADQPDEVEGLRLLQAGVYGYCNTYMAPPQLGRAVEVVRGGEVWVGWKLMQRLITGLGGGVNGEPIELPEELSALTEREREIAGCVAKGASNKDIASRLDITERTVKAHLSTIFRKTATRDRLQLALLVKESAEGLGGHLRLKEVGH